MEELPLVTATEASEHTIKFMKPQILASGHKLAISTLEGFENNLQIVLPADYRNFLLQNNGGKPEPNFFPLPPNPVDTHAMVDLFFGVNEDDVYDLEWNFRTMQGRTPAGMVPIATDPGGNLICLQTSGTNVGKIYFWDHEEELFTDPEDEQGLLLVANSFDEFLQSFTRVNV